MTDVAFFFVGLVAGTYAGLVCKKNRITILPQTIDIGKYGSRGDVDK